jgi:hypothetical protein
MCGHIIRTSAQEAEEKLARLLSSQLNVQIEPKALGILLKDKWAIIAAYAHIIHDDKSESFQQGSGQNRQWP